MLKNDLYLLILAGREPHKLETLESVKRELDEELRPDLRELIELWHSQTEGKTEKE